MKTINEHLKNIAAHGEWYADIIARDEHIKAIAAKLKVNDAEAEACVQHLVNSDQGMHISRDKAYALEHYAKQYGIDINYRKTSDSMIRVWRCS